MDVLEANGWVGGGVALKVQHLDGRRVDVRCWVGECESGEEDENGRGDLHLGAVDVLLLKCLI